MDKPRTLYQCNPELFEKCKKTHCQKECTLTTFMKYAKTDEFGEPIINIIDNLYDKEPQAESEE